MFCVQNAAHTLTMRTSPVIHSINLVIFVQILKLPAYEKNFLTRKFVLQICFCVYSVICIGYLESNKFYIWHFLVKNDNFLCLNGDNVAKTITITFCIPEKQKKFEKSGFFS